MARVPLLDRTDLPEEYRYLLDEDVMGELNLFRAMGNNPEVFQSYVRYGSTLWTDAGLEQADVERCILAIARTLDARYEWHQHVPIARDAGVPDDEILAIADGDLDGFDDRHRALLEYVQAVAEGDVDDATHEALAAHVDDETVVGATLLAGQYLATARFLDALDVPLEDSFVGWDLEGE
jgi:alkylhydroperoxidase family enzyme